MRFEQESLSPSIKTAKDKLLNVIIIILLFKFLNFKHAFMTESLCFNRFFTVKDIFNSFIKVLVVKEPIFLSLVFYFF